MLNLPSLTERAHILTFKFINRAIQLPSSTLLIAIIPCFTKANYCPHQHQWCKLLCSSPFRPFTRPPLPNGKLSPIVKLYRQNELHQRFSKTENNMYLLCCRPELKIDPILFLPMSPYDRNRLFRWRRGWLPSSKPGLCPICKINNYSTRQHLIECYQLIASLDLHNLHNESHPLDTVLNRLPVKPPITEPLKTETYYYWLHRWPLILNFLKDIDHLLHEGSDQVREAMVTQPELLLDMLHPDK